MAEIAVSLAIKAAEQLVGKLVGILYDKISGELSLLIGVREEVQDIICELKVMSAYLRDAEEKPPSSEAARAWVNEVKMLAYNIEDCLERVSLHLDDRCSENTVNATLQHLHRLALCCGPLGDRYHIANQIQHIKSKVQYMGMIRQRYGIVDARSSSSSDKCDGAQLNSQLAALYTEDSQLVGIDGPRETLVSWLLDETRHELSLIAVVGGGGLGKTTLARKAYNALNFTCRAWITVSQVYHIEGILRDMIKQLNPSTQNDLDNIGSMDLTKKLIEYLKDKRYIIVFDDIWEKGAWENLRYALSTNDLGSRVILTTRNTTVANYCCSQIPGHIYHQKKLSSEQSMELFCKRVFHNPDRTCPEDLKKVSQDILHKCDGLPLAIISIAGLLASKPNSTSRDWENILSHLGSKLEGALEGAERILTLSYNDLPYQVKPCFLYLSKFPEDYEIERKLIQRLWIAEGFVAGHDGMTAEVVAEYYFNELTNRSLIIPSSFSVVNRKVKSFRVHDIMRELIVSKSREENFVCVLGMNNNGWEPERAIRRLSIYLENSSMNLNNLSHVKSLSMFGFHKDITSLPFLHSPSLGLLRVLDFNGCKPSLIGNSFPQMKLLHLKYLSLRNTGTSMCPMSWRGLPNLETLDIRGSRMMKITEEMTQLRKLSFLRGDFWESPRDLGRLRALKELSVLEICNEHAIKEIGKLTQLKKIAVVFYDYVPRGEDFSNSLEAISSSLRSLQVESWHPLEFMKKLSSPPLLLEHLRLDGNLGTLPTWVASLNNLLKIVLIESHLEGNAAINALGSLPKLIKLVLTLDSYIGESLSFGAEKFPSLKVLHLSDLSKVSSLSFEGGAMRHLESLIVKYCQSDEPRLSISGIRNLLSLKEVHTHGLCMEDGSSLRTQITGHPNNPMLKAT